MKRRKFFAAAAAGVAGMSLLPKTASAEHHRGHTIGHLDSALANEDRMRVRFERFQDVTEFPEDVHKAGIHYIVDISTPAIVRLINEAVFVLQTGTDDDLFTVRRILNQPHWEGSIRHPRSLHYYSFLQLHWLHKLVPLINSDNAEHFQNTMYYMNAVWKGFATATWHINDGTNEEYYDDPDFAEH